MGDGPQDTVCVRLPDLLWEFSVCPTVAPRLEDLLESGLGLRYLSVHPRVWPTGSFW